MHDKSLDVFLMVWFGVGGVIILIIAWVQPMPLSERILSVFIGSVGLLWVLIRALMLTASMARAAIGKSPSQVKFEEGSINRY